MNTKQLAGEKAAEYVEDGMTVGLGTGSTAYWTICKLGERVQDGLSIRGLPTSLQTEKLANELGIPLVDFRDVNELDVTIDGADEVNPQLDVIKGGGGALLREKVVAAASKRLVIVVGDSKYVQTLGAFPLPVEIVPFGWQVTAQKVADLGGAPQLRMAEGAKDAYKTDNGNYILDCSFQTIADPHALHAKLNDIPGVVDNGLFVKMVDHVIIGNKDGTIHYLNR